MQMGALNSQPIYSIHRIMGIYWDRFLKGLLEGVTQLRCHFPRVFPACSHESYPCLGVRYDRALWFIGSQLGCPRKLVNG